MQVIDTRIGNITDGFVTVEFRGEGGELVSVRMAADGSLHGDAAVRHAKAVLVQVTAFDGERDENHIQNDARPARGEEPDSTGSNGSISVPTRDGAD